MPVLTNPKHEAYAQMLAKGMTQEKAYVEAGYAPNKGHAARLAGKGNVKARVTELQSKAAVKTVEAISFGAADMFKRLYKTCQAAEDAGDHKASIDGQKFILRCFGYEDSPTLTHEHVADRKLERPEQPEGEQDRAPAAPVALVDMTGALKALRKHMN